MSRLAEASKRFWNDARPFLFWTKVEPVDSGCWEWRGGGARGGYGKTDIMGKTLRAHRAAFEMCIGPIPPGKLLMHSCDNPRCVRPSHLSIGTDADNARDKCAKGRSAAQRKTHCKRGHPFDEANTRWHGPNNRRRACRACREIYKDRY